MDAIRRRAWWGLAALSAVLALLGLGDLLGGPEFESTTAVTLTGRTLAELEAASPDAYRVLDHAARGGGITLTALGAALTAIVAFAYRRGDRWAWPAMWLLPGWLLAGFVLALVSGTAPGQALSTPALSGAVMAAIAVVLLAVDLPRFLPRPETVGTVGVRSTSS
jgi:hypothetical protein